MTAQTPLWPFPAAPLPNPQPGPSGPAKARLASRRAIRKARPTRSAEPAPF